MKPGNPPVKAELTCDICNGVKPVVATPVLISFGTATVLAWSWACVECGKELNSGEPYDELPTTR